MAEVDNRYKVLFVCLGNICRSPAAHGIFEHIVRREGAQDMVEVDSAGTYGKHRGELPDRRMREAASARGYSLTHISRPVSALDLLEFDLILAMDDQNYQNLMNIAPSVEAARKVKRMSEYLTDNRFHTSPILIIPAWTASIMSSISLRRLVRTCSTAFV